MVIAETLTPTRNHKTYQRVSNTLVNMPKLKHSISGWGNTCFLIYFKFTTNYVIANSNPIISSLSCTLNSQYAKNDINSLETHSVLYHSISHHCLYLISGKNKRIKNQSCICYGKSEEKFKPRKILSNYFSEIIQNLVVKYLKYSCKCSLA